MEAFAILEPIVARELRSRREEVCMRAGGGVGLVAAANNGGEEGGENRKILTKPSNRLAAG